ncbi:MAG: hypothetical protein WD995_00160 [Gemmatimonadota bacterium]
MERASPGLAALFGAMKDDGRHSILDLGDANHQHLSVLSPYARRMRFAGLVPEPPVGDAFGRTVAALPPHPEQPYDVVLAWDVFDRLDPDDRTKLMRRLVEITAPHARLYAAVDVSGEPVIQPARITLVSADRIAQEVVGPPATAKPQLLPAQAERLLSPFVVNQAFSLRVGVREYVATRE